LLLFFDTVIIF